MNRSKRVYLGFSALTLPWLLAGSTASRADDDATFNRTPRDCVITQSISRTDILDDQTIIFYMRGKNVAYRNYLPKKCPGLKRWDKRVPASAPPTRVNSTPATRNESMRASARMVLSGVRLRTRANPPATFNIAGNSGCNRSNSLRK